MNETFNLFKNLVQRHLVRVRDRVNNVDPVPVQLHNCLSVYIFVHWENIIFPIIRILIPFLRIGRLVKSCLIVPKNFSAIQSKGQEMLIFYVDQKETLVLFFTTEFGDSLLDKMFALFYAFM